MSPRGGGGALLFTLRNVHSAESYGKVMSLLKCVFHFYHCLRLFFYHSRFKQVPVRNVPPPHLFSRQVAGAEVVGDALGRPHRGLWSSPLLGQTCWQGVGGGVSQVLHTTRRLLAVTRRRRTTHQLFLWGGDVLLVSNRFKKLYHRKPTNIPSQVFSSFF